ncbi:MAG: hypothetical protein ACI835_005893, partial [Planctomycetota bacterium]
FFNATLAAIAGSMAGALVVGALVSWALSAAETRQEEMTRRRVVLMAAYQRTIIQKASRWPLRS